jgi:hypothetical protein
VKGTPAASEWYKRLTKTWRLPKGYAVLCWPKTNDGCGATAERQRQRALRHQVTDVRTYPDVNSFEADPYGAELKVS